jgi:hypothetical protein
MRAKSKPAWPTQCQIARHSARMRQLGEKPSQLFGGQAWRDSGLGALEDLDKLGRRITEGRVVLAVAVGRRAGAVRG